MHRVGQDGENRGQLSVGRYDVRRRLKEKVPAGCGIGQRGRGAPCFSAVRRFDDLGRPPVADDKDTLSVTEKQGLAEGEVALGGPCLSFVG